MDLLCKLPTDLLDIVLAYDGKRCRYSRKLGKMIAQVSAHLDFPNKERTHIFNILPQHGTYPGKNVINNIHTVVFFEKYSQYNEYQKKNNYELDCLVFRIKISDDMYCYLCFDYTLSK